MQLKKKEDSIVDSSGNQLLFSLLVRDSNYHRATKGKGRVRKLEHFQVVACRGDMFVCVVCIILWRMMSSVVCHFEMFALLATQLFAHFNAH